MSDTCRTKYPIVLVHGIGYTDTGRGGYWGRIPSFLEDHGADVWFGHQDSFGTIEGNGKQLKESVDQVLSKTGAEKVNLIAHSKGGIEARYMITALEMGRKVASLTTIATPHRGIQSMDHLKRKRNFLYTRMIGLFNLLIRVSSGEKPGKISLYDQLTADYMQVFNELVPDDETVYYQSYAFDMKWAGADPTMGIFHTIIKQKEGINDGLVSAASAKWGDFRGVYSGPGKIGISHPATVDTYKRALTQQQRGGGILDITDLYWDIVSRLKGMGF